MAFYGGATLLDAIPLQFSGGTTTASFTTSSLSVSAHTITAVYIGDELFVSTFAELAHEVVEEQPPIILSAGQDSFTRSVSDNTNEGANLNLIIRAGGNNRTLVSFDLTGLTGPVGQATLRLYIVDNAENWGNKGRTIDAHRLLQPWTEGDGANLQPANLTGAQFNPYKNRGDGPGVTWKCATDSEVHNVATNCNPKWNGGVFAATPSDTLTIYKDFGGNNQLPPTTATVGWISFDVTADVNTCLANSATTCSWLVKKTQEGLPGRVEFASKEGASALYNSQVGEAVAPQLVIGSGVGGASAPASDDSQTQGSQIFLPLVTN